MSVILPPSASISGGTQASIAGRRYGEPEWNLPTAQAQAGEPGTITAHLLSDKSYEELRIEAIRSSMSGDWNVSTVPEAFGGPGALFNLLNQLETVQIKIPASEGPSAAWTVHKHLLVHASSFAKAALSNQWSENQDGAITLPDEEPEVVGLFIRYLYTGSLKGLENDAKLKLYVFADKLQASALKAELRAALLFTSFIFSPPQACYILDNTSTPDPLRATCLQQICMRISMKLLNVNDEAVRYLSERHASEILQQILGMTDSQSSNCEGQDNSAHSSIDASIENVTAIVRGPTSSLTEKPLRMTPLSVKPLLGAPRSPQLVVGSQDDLGQISVKEVLRVSSTSQTLADKSSSLAVQEDQNADPVDRLTPTPGTSSLLGSKENNLGNATIFAPIENTSTAFAPSFSENAQNMFHFTGTPEPAPKQLPLPPLVVRTLPVSPTNTSQETELAVTSGPQEPSRDTISAQNRDE